NRAEMARKAVSQPHSPSKASAGAAGAQDPNGRKFHIVGDGLDPVKRVVLWKILERERNELAKLGRKLGGVKGAEGLRRGWIGARRPADPQVNPPGVKRFQRVKSLGHPQRCVVR